MRRARLIVLLFFGLIHIFPLFTGYLAYAEILTEEEQEYLREKGTIVFVSQTLYPPFEFLGNDGDHTGMCIELARWMATELGFKAKFTDTDFKYAQEGILSGKADVLTSLFYSEKRDNDFDFTETVFLVPASIFVAADRPDIKELGDLNGKTIAMQKGDYALEFLESEGISSNVVYTSNFAEATDLVISGKADAIIGDEQIVLYHLYFHNLTRRIKKVGEPLYVGQNCMAVREGEKILVNILNKGITLARVNGVLDRINRKWLGVQYSTQESFLAKHGGFILTLAGGLFLIVVLVWFWNIRLRREVTKRTEELSRSERTLRTILAASPVGIGVVRNNTLDWHNQTMTRILGYEQGELQGATAAMLYSDREEARRVHRAILEGLQREGTVSVETKWRRKDGSVFDCLLRYVPIEGEEGNTSVAIALAEDITERKRAENKLRETHAQLEATFNALPDLLFEVDSQGRILNYHTPHSELLYMEPSLFLGKRVTEVLPRDAAEVIMHSIHEAWKRGRSKGAIYSLNIGDKHYWYELSVASAGRTEGAQDRLVALVRDITERKQMEELMRIQRDLGVALGFVGDLQEALVLCLDAALQVREIDCGGIYLVDARNGSISLAVHKGLPKDLVKTASYYDGQSGHALAITRGEPIFQLYENVMETLGLNTEDREAGKKAGLRGVAILPVKHEGKIIAALNVASRSNDVISDFARYSLEAITSQIAGTLTRIKSDQALKASQHNLQTLFESLDDFLFVLDSKGNIIEFNPIVKERLGYSAEELLTLNVLNVHPPERRDEAAAIVKGMFEGQTVSCPVPLLSKEGQLIPVETKITLGTWNNQEAIFGISRDISERLAVEAAKRKSEERLLAAIDAIDEGFAIYDAEDRLTMCNAKYLEVYKDSADLPTSGARFEDIIQERVRRGQYVNAVGRAEDWIAERMLQHLLADSSSEQRLSDGRWVRVSERKTKDGSTVGFSVDITDIKRSEERAQAALKEKETLLREIHHRVKNNMQVVSSLLSLQADKIEDQQVADALTEARSRVHSMSLVHEILYKSENLTDIDLHAYFEHLTQHLSRAFVLPTGKVGITVNAVGVRVEVDQAIPCGLIVTELLINALKYAFPEKDGGEIRIEATCETGDNIVLTVADNGIGLPGDFDPSSAKTLGLRLVTELVEDQLEGSWALDTAGGTRWTIRWPRCLR